MHVWTGLVIEVICTDKQYSMNKRFCKWVVISGTLFIWAIKYGIRPVYIQDDFFRFFLNIAPNWIGSFLIPFAAAWLFNGRKSLPARLFCVEPGYQLRFVALVAFGLLVINEYLQRIPLFGRTFDYNDIIFSAVGLLVASFVFSNMGWKRAGSFAAKAG